MRQDAAEHAERRVRIYRHSLPVRMTHWIGVAGILVLLMSGLQIFNAHPALYWGEASDFARPILAIGATREDGRLVGLTSVFGHSFNTTGVLGVSGPARTERAFPAWLTLPRDHDL